MGSVRMAHTIWLMRRAVLLEGLSPDACDETPDPDRAALLHRVADKISHAIEAATPMNLTSQERATLTVEALELTARATAEIGRVDQRKLDRAEEDLRIAHAFREVVEAALTGTVDQCTSAAS